MKDESYIVIQGWMRNQLKLKGNDLLVYAIIYGFSQTEGNKFTGSLRYLSEWCGASKNGIQKNLQNLLDMGLIQKEETYNNGVKFCAYSVVPCTTQLDGVYNSVVQGIQLSCMGGIQLSCTNNIEKDNKDNISKDTIDRVVEEWNALPEVKKIQRIPKTGERPAMLKARISEYGLETVVEVIRKVGNSSFLLGHNNRKWKATFDWVLKPSNFIKVLEDTYTDKNEEKVDKELAEIFGMV